MRHLLVAALAGGLVLGAVACGGGGGSAATTRIVARRPSLTVTPSSVPRGDTVTVSGSAGDCPAGDDVTLISSAFPHTQDFAGLPALSATVEGDGSFSTSTTIPAGTQPGGYDITARCGGGNLGLVAHLTVTG